MREENTLRSPARAGKSLDRRFAALQGSFFAAYAGTSFFSYILLQKGLPEFLIGCEGHGAGSANAVNWPIYTARMKACTRPGSQGSQGGNGWISRGKWPS